MAKKCKQLADLVKFENNEIIALCDFRSRKKGDKLKQHNVRGYKTVHIFGANHYIHQLNWYLTYKYWPIEINHKDGIRSNNFISNLEEVTHKENQNRMKNNKSYPGVYYDKRRKPRKRWYASVYANNKNNYSIGVATKEEAIKDHKLLIALYG